MTDLEKLAWKIYCETTWTPCAKDFWEDLNPHEKAWSLAAARAVQAGALKLRDRIDREVLKKMVDPNKVEIDQEYWT